MKKVNFFPALFALLLISAAGCQMAKPMDEAAIKAKADSIVTAQMPVIADSANKYCESNRTAWIQAKADSIYQSEKGK